MISSDQVNTLVYRYLLEQGFRHSVFCFQHEAGLHALQPVQMREGLVSLLLKGLLYMEVEEHLGKPPCCAPFTLVGTHECQGVQQGNAQAQAVGSHAPYQPNNAGSPSQESKDLAAFMRLQKSAGPKKHGRKHKHRDAESGQAIDQNQRDAQRDQRDTQSTHIQRDMNNHRNMLPDQNQESQLQQQLQSQSIMDITQSVCDIPAERVQIYSGHTSQVFVLKFNPVHPILATGSADGTARLWHLHSSELPTVLEHLPFSHKKDITALEWASTGELLATGAYDSRVRIYSRAGKLILTLQGHSAPLCCLAYNPSSTLLASGSLDHSVVIWDAAGTQRQVFSFHTGAVLDIVWQTDFRFSSASVDTMVFTCELGNPEPTELSAHASEVNVVRYNPSKTLLATGSDDKSLCVWSCAVPQSPQRFFHDAEVYTLAWVNDTILCSGSFDTTVRVWDVQASVLVHSFSVHSAPVFSLSFYNNVLVSGGSDGVVCVFDAPSADKILEGPECAQLIPREQKSGFGHVFGVSVSRWGIGFVSGDGRVGFVDVVGDGFDLWE